MSLEARPQIEQMGQARPRLLVANDVPQEMLRYQAILAEADYQVTCVANEHQATHELQTNTFVAVLCGATLNNPGALALLQAVRQYDLDVPIIVITEGQSLDLAIASLEHGALRYLTKPILPKSLLDTVGQVVLLQRTARAKRDALAQPGSQRTSLTAGLDQALASLWMAYQPIVHWPQRRVFGFEALVRSKEATLPNPPALFDAADKLGRLVEVSRCIRAQVAADITQRGHTLPEGCAIFVNLHTRDLLDELLYDPHSPLSQHAGRIVLEITERTALDDVCDVGDRVAKLRALGFRIAIDDLGAGYAGLSTFAQLEPEVVKLDMSLVRDIHLRPTKRKIIATMATLCRELGMQVVAEGIETERERDIVEQLGCALLQGYWFGRPAQEFIIPSFSST